MIPTYGAVIMSDNMVLLVQHYWPQNFWGFPKGKIEEEEDPFKCATREVFEETGYDISKSANPNTFIEGVYKGRKSRLYVVDNVPREKLFAPRHRNEIKQCKWFNLDTLISYNNEEGVLNASSHFMMTLLVRFINEQKSLNYGVENTLVPPRKGRIATNKKYTVLIRKKIEQDENNIPSNNKRPILTRG